MEANITKVKRRQRAYKCTDEVYNKAREVAAAKGTTVANAVENFLIEFGKEAGSKPAKKAQK